MQQTISELVVAVLARHTGMEPDEIEPSMRVREELGLDSIDAAEIMLIVEQETGRHFALAEDEEIHTVADLIATVSGLRR